MSKIDHFGAYFQLANESKGYEQVLYKKRSSGNLFILSEKTVFCHNFGADFELKLISVSFNLEFHCITSKICTETVMII